MVEDVGRSEGKRAGRWLRWVLLAVVLGLVAVVVGSQGKGAVTDVGRVHAGVRAPGFCLRAVQGGTYSLSGLLAEGKVVLLSFIDTQAEAGEATPDPSQRQVVFLWSMDVQYAARGAQVLIVDVSSLATGRQPDEGDLAGFVDDHDLDAVPVLDDHAGTVARAYGVTRAPMTFLIKADGTIGQVWEGFAPAPRLAFALVEQVGEGIICDHRAPPTVSPDEFPSCSITPPQPTFAGHGLSRALSENIWVVDAGRAWESGEGSLVPLTWVILGGRGTCTWR